MQIANNALSQHIPAIPALVVSGRAEILSVT